MNVKGVAIQLRLGRGTHAGDMLQRMCKLLQSEPFAGIQDFELHWQSFPSKACLPPLAFGE